MQGDRRTLANEVRGAPLAGLRALELSHYVAGPAAGLALCELGADTIRIEAPPLGGDPAQWPELLGWASFYNRGKRSVAIDLKSSEGKEIFLRLLRTADVVLDNFAPGVLENLGFPYEELAAANPRLIYLSIKGFLPGTSDGTRPLMDELAQMASGLAHMTGLQGRPMRTGSSLLDLGAAAYGVIGVLAALLERQRTGLGQKVDSGIFETGVFVVGQHMANAALSGEPSVPLAERPQGKRMGAAVYRLFSTSDDKQVFVGVASDGHWQRLCDEFELDDLLAHPDLQDRAARVAAHPWLLPRLSDEFGRFTAEELQEKLRRARVLFAPLRRPDELFEDRHLLELGQIVDTHIPGHGTAKLPKLPISNTSRETGEFRAAPGVGEHTREILASLGCSDGDVTRLAEGGAVFVGVPLEASLEANGVAR